MNDRNDSVHLCSPGTDREQAPRAARRRARRALLRRWRGASRPVRYGLLGAAAFCAVSGAAEPVYAQRGMAGVDVSSIVSGDVTFRRTRGGLTINASDGAIIEFERFNIPRNNLVRFNQPGANASVLSRVVGPEASLIQGTLLANGQVFLINPSGITFGPGARVNVGAMFAAAGQLSNADFRRGVHNFTGLTGAVVNQGRLKGDAGVSLAGASVENAGTIVASRGVVSLAAGDNVFVAERGSSVLVRIDGPGFGADATPAPPADGVGVRNTGTISGAEVIFSAGDLHSLALRNEGTITSTGGRVTLDTPGTATNSGVIDASDRSAGGVGGQVRLLGDHVVQEGVIDASGDVAGGTIMVGGSFRGLGPERNASTTIITSDSVLRADALTKGDGGEIAIWGTDGAYVAGEISARQGALGGDGGFVEASADALLLRASVDAGVGGAFLVDPQDLTIEDGNAADPLPDSSDFTFDGLESSITNGSIEDVLNSGSSLVLEAQNDILVTADIDSSGGNADGNLTLRAGRSIDVSNNTQITTDADITLQANYYEDGDSAINDIIAGNPGDPDDGRLAGDAQILFGNQVDITAGGELRLEVRAQTTPNGADGMPVGVVFEVGDIALGGAGNDTNRADLAGVDVVVVAPEGLVANADITATNSVLLHAGADGAGTLTFAPAANQSTIDSPTTTLRAGNGASGVALDLSGDAPALTSLTSLTVRQDAGIVDSTGLLSVANINGGSAADLDYTLQSDAGSISLDGFANLLDADLTLRTAGTVDFTAASDLGDVRVTGLVDDARAGAVTIEQSMDLAGGGLTVESDSFEVSGGATTLTSTGAVSIDSTGAVNIAAPVSGDVVTIGSTTDTTTVASNVTGVTSVDLAGETGLDVGAGVALNSPSIALRATGAGAQVGLGAGASLVGVTDFTYELADPIDNSNLIAGLVGLTDYTIESGGTITLDDAGPVNNTNLTLNAGGAVALNGGAGYTLTSLTVDAGGAVTAAAAIDVTNAASITANVGIADTLAINLPDLDVGATLSLNTDSIALVESLTGGYTLGASNIGEAVSITANGAVTGGDLVQVGAGTLDGGEVTLIDAASVNLTALDSAVPVSLSTTGNVALVSPNALTIESSTIGGGLTATAQAGSLTLQNSIDVTGAASLTAIGATSDINANSNQLLTTTDVTVDAGRDVLITRAGGGTLAIDAGRDASVSLTGTGQTEILASSIGNDLSLTSEEKVFSTALVDVGRNAAISANTTDALPLAIDFGALDLGANGVLTLNTTGIALATTTSANGYELGASTAGVALFLSAANGEITSDQKITVGNGALIPGSVTNLNAERASLTDLNSLVPISLNLTDGAASSTIINDGAITLQGVTVAGNFTATAQAGGITDDGSAVITGDGVFTANGAGGLINLDQSTVGGQTSLGATGAVTFATSQAADILALTAGDDVFLEAPDLTFSGSIAATGAGVDLTIRPSATDLSVGLGDGAGAPGQEFTLSAADLGNLADGFQSITIGRSDAFTDTLIIGNGVEFSDPVTLRRPTDGVSATTIANGLTGNGDASFTMLGSALGDLNISGAITTQGGSIALNDAVTMTGDLTLRTTQGGSNGADISAGAISAAVAGVGNVVVDAGTSGAVTLGDIGGGGATAQSFDLQGATTANIGLVTAAGQVSLTADALTTGAVTSTTNQAVSFATDSLTLNGAVSTTGDLLVQTRTPGQNIGVNVAVGGLDLEGANFANLFGGGGYNSVTIGRANGSGTLTVGGAGIDFADATTLRSPAGEIVVDSQILLGGTAPLTLTAQTVRARTSIYTSDGDLRIDGRTIVEADSIEIGAIGPGGVSKRVIVGPIDAAAGESFALGGGQTTSLELTGDIGASGAAGLVQLVTQEGVEIGAPTVSITADDLIIFDAVDSVSGQTNSLAITLLNNGVAQLFGAIGGGTLADAATLSSLTITGASTLNGGVVQTTGGQTYNGPVSLGVDTTFQAESGVAEFGGGLAAGGLNVDIDGAAALTGGTLTALTLDFLGATTVDNAVTIDGGDVLFASTLDGASADAGDLTLDSTARLEGRVGDSSRLGDLQLGAVTVATDVVNTASIDLGGDVTVEPGLLTISGTGVIVFQDSKILTNNGSNLIINSTIDGPAMLTLEGFNLATLRGDIGSTTALAGLDVTGASHLEMQSINAGNVNFQGPVTIDTPLLTMTGADVRFGSTVASLANAGNSLTVTASNDTRFVGEIGAGAGALGDLLVNGGGTTYLEATTANAATATFDDAVLLELGNQTLTLTGDTVRFNDTLGSGLGESNSLTVNALTTHFGDVVSNLNAVMTDAAGTTTLDTPSFTATSATFLDDVVLADTIPGGVLTLTADTATFGQDVDAQSAGAASLTVNAGTTRFGGDVGSNGRINALTTNAAGTTTIDGEAIDANVVALNDSARLTNSALTIDANTVTLAAVDSDGSGTDLTVNSTTLALTGPVGGSQALGSMTTNSAGTTTISNSVRTTGDQQYQDDVRLSGDLDGAAISFGQTLEVTGASSIDASSGATFADTVDGAGSLTVTGASAAFAGALQTAGATTIDVNGAATFGDIVEGAGTLDVSGSSADFNGALLRDGATTVTVTGDAAFNDAVSVGDALSVTASNATFADALQVGTLVDVDATGGAVMFAGDVGGGGDLAVTASTVDFAQSIGATNTLGSLTVDADAEITLNGGLVDTSGGQSFNGDLRLATNTTFNGEDVSIIGTLRSTDGAAERIVTINASDQTVLDGDFADISELRTDAPGMTSLRGDFVGGELLFADDVILIGDTSIEATGDAGIAFLGSIDSDSVNAARRLTLQIDRQVIADIEAGLQPGETLEQALLERLQDEQRPLPTISFGGDIGVNAPLGELLLNIGGTRTDPAVYATIIGVNRLPDGRVDLENAIDLQIIANRFEMGVNEKFTVLGSLAIESLGNAASNIASEILLGDVTVASTLSLTVADQALLVNGMSVDPRIVLLGRDVGELLAPAEDPDDVLGLVDGADVLDRIDLVAGGSISFSRAPVIDVSGISLGDTTGVISGTSANLTFTEIGDLELAGVPLRVFPRTPIPLSDLVLRIESSDPMPTDIEPILFGAGVVDVVLDFTSDGLTLASSAGLEGVTGIFAETAAGAVEDEVLLSQSVRDQLEAIGLNARDPVMTEITNALAGRAVYNDFNSEATASDEGVGYGGEIVVTRLPRNAAEAVVARYQAIVGPDEERLQAFKAALAEAYGAYFETAPDEMLDDDRLLAAGFATRVSSTQAGSELDQGLVEVAQLLEQIEDLGVTRFEYEAAAQEVLRKFTPDGRTMSSDELRVVLEWYKDRLGGEQASAPAPATDTEGAAS